MRLDLFLKNTRLLKRRSSAKALVLEGGVLLNGRPAKPGRDVGPGDVLTFPGDDDGDLERRVEVLAEARRPVPHGREPEFFRFLD
jgi:ribosomal 50S subunit-recycling heat shock protein